MDIEESVEGRGETGEAATSDGSDESRNGQAARRDGTADHRHLGRSATRLAGSPWLFPLVALMLVIVLGSCKVSFSSVGMYAEATGRDAADTGAVFGQPRGIRSDEWYVRTPWVVRQAANGFSTSVIAGVGNHEVALISELPVSSWQTFSSPASLYYRVFDVERAVAFEWMSWLALQSVGVYALLYAITRRVGLSAFGGLLMLLSPISQWWTVCATYTVIGWACLSASALIWSARAQRPARRYGLSVASGAALACATASMYLPWVIAAVVVLVPVVVATLWADASELGTVRLRLRRIGPPAIIAGVIAIAVFGAVLVSYRGVADAMAATIYPGDRTSVEGGGMPAASALGAPLDWFASAPAAATINGNNQSENSSGLFLLLPAALALFAIRQAASERRRVVDSLPLWASGATAVVAAGWVWLPLPPWLGSIVGFNRIPPARMLLMATLAGIVFFVLVLAEMDRCNRRLSTGSAVFVGAVFAAVHGWAAGTYTVDGLRPDLRIAAVLIFVVSAGVALSVSKARQVGLSLILAFSFVLAARINPVQVGLGALLDNDLRSVMEDIGGGDPADSWAVFSLDARVRGIVHSVSVPNVSGVSVYPVVDAWDVLDPEDDDASQWNRFAIVSLVEADSEGEEIAFSVPAPDSVWVHISPCDERLRDLSVRYVVVPSSSTATCGTTIDSVALAGERFVVRDLGD